MKVLLVGGGGREHAIAQALRRSPQVDKLYCAPGNAGIARVAECVKIGTMDFDALTAFAEENGIDLTVCSMDDPLCAGIVDAFEAKGLRIFGTPANAAIIEGSKAFSKDLMKKYGIPTAAYEIFDDPGKALAYLGRLQVVCGIRVYQVLLRVQILEETLEGSDMPCAGSVGLLAVPGKPDYEGEQVIRRDLIEHLSTRKSQDHKRAGDGDTGLNTGGMGTFSPSPFYTKEVDEYCRENIYQKTMDAMAAEGRPFRGVLYFGLMLTADGPRVLEYNTRFGDPETQVVLPRMKSDIIDVMQACIDGTLDKIELEFEDNAAVCVVIASGGYPGSYEKGKVITGLENFDGKDGYFCFHAGTAFNADGETVTSGGRVLGVTALGDTLIDARANAYKAVEWVLRHDIGKAIDAVK